MDINIEQEIQRKKEELQQLKKQAVETKVARLEEQRKLQGVINNVMLTCRSWRRKKASDRTEAVLDELLKIIQERIPSFEPQTKRSSSAKEESQSDNN